MKKKNMLTLLGIAFVVAVVATGVFYGLFVSNLKSNAPSRTLVVAAKHLDAGKTLTPADVKTVSWPSPELPKGAYDKVDQVAGTVLKVMGPKPGLQLPERDGAVPAKQIRSDPAVKHHPRIDHWVASPSSRNPMKAFVDRSKRTPCPDAL